MRDPERSVDLSENRSRNLLQAFALQEGIFSTNRRRACAQDEAARCVQMLLSNYHRHRTTQTT